MINIHDLFNQHLPAAMARNPDRARAIDTRFQIVVTGENGGEWLIDASPSGPSVVKGRAPDGRRPDITLTLSNDVAQQLFADPTIGMKLFMSGALRIDGNILRASKLDELAKLAS